MVESIKPKGLVSIIHARQPKRYFSSGTFYLPDYVHLAKQFEKRFPGILDGIPLENPNLEKPVAQTPLRRLLNKAIIKDVQLTHQVIGAEESSMLINALESALLPLIPSYRQKPDREIIVEQKAFDPRISQESAVRIVEALEGHGYWTPLHFLDLGAVEPMIEIVEEVMSDRTSDPFSLFERFKAQFDEDP